MVYGVAGIQRRIAGIAALVATIFALAWHMEGRAATPPAKEANAVVRPKLVVILVVDQMRADYLDKFRAQWTGGLKRLLEEGAWFRDAAYPYAATETCVGHATISTGAFPTTHGMISNEWWDRNLDNGKDESGKDKQKGGSVTCTDDPKVKNFGYAGISVTGGNSAAKLLVPAFADELKYQTGATSRVVAFSLKARAAIMLGGRLADSVTWFDPAVGAWTTSSAYPVASFVEEFAKAHPVTSEFGKTWAPLLPSSAYFYPQAALGAVPPAGFGAAFPHPLRGKPDGKGPDPYFYEKWESSPAADTALVRMAETAVDKLELGKRTGTDFLGIGFSSPDLVGHAFGPRSWEVQDILARLDRDVGDLFSHLDEKVGRGNYVVAFSSDHGVAPISEDLLKSGWDAGALNLEEVKERIEKRLETFHYAKPLVAEVHESNVYFIAGTYAKLKEDPAAMRAVLDAVQSGPGVAHVYRAEDLEDRPATNSSMQTVEAASFFTARSGDLLIVPKPYWSWDSSAPGSPRTYGAAHGSPYSYDQSVPVILMGFGISPGEYFSAITPADIAPTLALLCGITLAPRDGRILAEAIAKPPLKLAPTKPLSTKPRKTTP